MVFAELRMLNDLIDLGTGFSYMNNLSFSDSVYNIQWELNIICHDGRKDACRIERSCALAGLLYVECFLRDVNPSSMVVARFVQSLHTSMEETAKTSKKSLLDNSNSSTLVDLWFWSLFLGGMIINVATKDEKDNWFAHQLAQIIGQMDIAGWESVESKLRKVCYSCSKMRELGQAFWLIVQSHSKSQT